jgi:uncharacterized protein DUF6763
MSDELEPVVGNWYLHRDKGETFKIIDIDRDSGAIEIQYFDGDLEEIDGDAWDEMDLEIAEPPEDETGPLDAAPPEEGGYTETEMTQRDRSEPLESVRPTSEEWEDDTDEDERDDWDEGKPSEELPGSEP